MHVRKTLLVGLSLAATSEAFAGWTSLGRVNSLTRLPNVAFCEQRFVSKYWNPNHYFTPTTKADFSSNQYYRFNLDLSSLSLLTSLTPAKSRFKAAVSFYNSLTVAKSISADIILGQGAGVSIQVFYTDTQGLVQGRGWGVDPSEIGFIEVQESCTP